MNIARRLAPIVVLVVAACVPGRQTTMRPGSDMHLPARPTKIEKKNGETCVTVRGVPVKGDNLKCSPLAPDSTQRPPTAKTPPQR